MHFEDKRKFRKILYSRVTLVILSLLIILLAHATYGIYSKERQSAAEYAAAKDAYDDLVSRQAALTSEVNTLGTSAGVEEEIRTRFGMAKPGETVVTVIAAPTSTASQGGGQSLWQTLFGWL